METREKVFISLCGTLLLVCLVVGYLDEFTLGLTLTMLSQALLIVGVGVSRWERKRKEIKEG
jgi:hypothetical protein